MPLHFIHDKRGVLLVIQVKDGFSTLHFNPHGNPLVQPDIGVGFKFAVRFSPQPIEFVVGIGKILDGVISGELAL